MGYRALSLAVLVGIVLVGCKSGILSQRDPVSAGTAKLFLDPGETTQTEVLESFGGPNIVAGGADGKETWTYDRMSYESSYVAGGGAGGAAGIIGSTPAAGLLWASAAKASSSSRTVTLFLYWESGVLIDFKYRSASF